MVQQVDGDSYSVDGAARVDDLEEALGLQVPEEGFPTLGGRVFEQLQRRPRVGDEVRLGNYRRQGRSKWTACASAGCCSPGSTDEAGQRTPSRKTRRAPARGDDDQED